MQRTANPTDGLLSLGKYEIKGTLGRGAMGTVYEGFDPHISRRVAIKTVRLPDAADEEAQEELARFRREAQAAGRLTHPNLVAVYDYGESADMAYIVMEFVDGKPLKAVLDAEERLSLPLVRRVMDDVLAGLGYSHGNGVIHRDIKPANVMLTSGGQAKIADFGIARIESSSMTQAGTVLGTPAYMSPEQFMGVTVDLRTDVYSSGVLLYQLLTGEKPFEGSLTTIMHKVLNTVPPRPSELSVTAPTALDQVVATAMARRPEERYASAGEFAEAIRTALEAPKAAAPAQALPDGGDATVVAAPRSGPASAPTDQDAPRAPPSRTVATPAGERRSRSLVPLAAGGVAALVAAGGVGWWLMREDPQPRVVAATTQQTGPTPDPGASTTRTDPVEPVPTQTVETQTVPSQTVPTQVTPTQTAPSQTLPTQAPSQGAPTQTAQTETPSTQTVPSQTAPAQITPTQTTPTQAVPSQTAPAQTTPAQTTPAQTTPTQTTPTQTTPTQTTPAQIVPTQPVATQAGSAPAGTAQGGTAPAGSAQTGPTQPAARSNDPPAGQTEAGSRSDARQQLASTTVPTSTEGTNTTQPRQPELPPPVTPEALRRTAEAMVRAAPCAAATADVGRDGRLTLRGIAGQGGPADALRRQAEGLRAPGVDWQVTSFDGPYCDVLDTVRTYIRTAGEGGPSIGLPDRRTVLFTGDLIQPTATVGGVPAFLQVDYVTKDGGKPVVVHMRTAAPGRDGPYPARSVQVIGQPRPRDNPPFPGYRVEPPYGTDLVVVVASSVPLFQTELSPTEPQDAVPYLARLRASIEAAVQRRGEVAANVFLLRTSDRR